MVCLTADFTSCMAQSHLYTFYNPYSSSVYFYVQLCMLRVNNIQVLLYYYESDCLNARWLIIWSNPFRLLKVLNGVFTLIAKYIQIGMYIIITKKSGRYLPDNFNNVLVSKQKIEISH